MNDERMTNQLDSDEEVKAKEKEARIAKAEADIAKAKVEKARFEKALQPPKPIQVIYKNW